MKDEQVREAAAMYAKKVSLSRIGKHFGVDGSVVGCELRKVGVEIRPQGVKY